MTEEDWWDCPTPWQGLLTARAAMSDRQLRLFACACCARVAPLMKDECALAALAFAGLMAPRSGGGKTRARGRPMIHQAVREVSRGMWSRDTSRQTAAEHLAYLATANATQTAEYVVEASAWRAAESVLVSAQLAVAYSRCAVPRTKSTFPPDRERHMRAEAKAQVALLHEIAGNPFRPVQVEARWLAWQGGQARAIAEGIAQTDDFVRAPVLADALEEAGCDDEGLLAHLRSPGPHVRGCWAVEALLRARS